VAIASFRGEDPVRHGGRSSAVAGRIDVAIASFRGADPVRHGGRSSAVAGRIKYVSG